MINNNNVLICDNFADTVNNLDSYMQLLCCAAEDDETCTPGFALGIKQAYLTLKWLKNNQPAQIIADPADKSDH